MAESNTFPAHISISDFGYELPDEQIARFPLEARDASKLLVWKKGNLLESGYRWLPDLLPDRALLVFNNSRVIEARMIFQKPSGGQIEIFCLEPHPDFTSLSAAMAETGRVLWVCLIGGASKWKRGQVLQKSMGGFRVEARFIEKRASDFIVEFSWAPEHLSFAALLHELGAIPLPPYLKRDVSASDAERYQTVYASASGSVAAPTAGLHFSEALLHTLRERHFEQLHLTLHVGAGTFMPVKSAVLRDHAMHEEFIEVELAAVKRLLLKVNGPVVAVGTTSLRTLESLYWLGLKISINKKIQASELTLDQWYPYEEHAPISAAESLQYLLEWMENQPEKKLVTKTQLFIVPGYRFRMTQGLITNFHQPHSTLLLLVAAFIGPEWKSVYRYALDHGYRFLSYGDGCLFLPSVI